MLLYLKLADSLAGMTWEVHDVHGTEGIIRPETAIYVAYGEDHQHAQDTDHQHAHGPQGDRVLDTTYEDVGGLSEQIAAVREFVELPLIFPQVYRQLGITPPRGVIFFGAPGTGKTLLARSVANEIHARFFYINGPEIVGTYGGQTEENLRKIFGEASLNPPSIIFIDELDAIAPIRGTTTHARRHAGRHPIAGVDGRSQPRRRRDGHRHHQPHRLDRSGAAARRPLRSRGAFRHARRQRRAKKSCASIPAKCR